MTFLCTFYEGIGEVIDVKGANNRQISRNYIVSRHIVKELVKRFNDQGIDVLKEKSHFGPLRNLNVQRVRQGTLNIRVKYKKLKKHSKWK